MIFGYFMCYQVGFGDQGQGLLLESSLQAGRHLTFALFY